MPDTPPNTVTATALKLEAQTTPVNAKLRDRAKGNDKVRAFADQAMVQEARYVEITLKDFKDKFLPVDKPFEKNKYDTTLDTSHLDVTGNVSRNERECYPDLVSDTSDLLRVSRRSQSTATRNIVPFHPQGSERHSDGVCGHRRLAR